jgi:hypothetical protein
VGVGDAFLCGVVYDCGLLGVAVLAVMGAGEDYTGGGAITAGLAGGTGEAVV